MENTQKSWLFSTLFYFICERKQYNFLCLIEGFTKVLTSNTYQPHIFLILGRYDNELIDIPFYTDSSRCNLFQLQRPRKRILEEIFFFQTCRLAKFVKIDLRQKNGLKKSALRVFWRRFEEYEELNKCTWRVGCDCLINNCRNKTSL